MNVLKKVPLICFGILCSLPMYAQVVMQSWYWDYPKTAQGANWTDTLMQQVPMLAAAGFTDIWLPPFSRTSSGSFSNGYDPRDLFDLGEYGQGPTGFGTASQVKALIDSISVHGMRSVADVVYNHRDGGLPEANPAVGGWIQNMNCTKINSGDQPYPSDRFRLMLPIGGSTGLGAGTYYIKVESRSGHPNFHGRPYRFYAETGTTGWQGLPDLFENESNNDGGGPCGQGSDAITLGRNIRATIDISSCGGACRSDEYALTVNAGQFQVAGDAIYIYLTNENGQYSDHTIAEIWYNGSQVASSLVYQTYTDFTQLPSGRGGMNYPAFKPNGNPTNLGGDWDYMYFYYDYDQGHPTAADTLKAFTRWLVESVGIEGLRMDAVKHFDPNFVADVLDDLYDHGHTLPMIVGEFYDGNAALLNNWVNSVYNAMDADTRAAMVCRVFDFTLRDALKQACDGFGYDVRNLYGSNMVAQGGTPSRVVTFCNNHDFRDAGAPIQNDADLAYAFMFLHGNLGSPSVFYPDYFGTDVIHTPGERLKTDIDILIKAKQQYIDGNWNHINLNPVGSFYGQSYASGYPNTTIAMQIKGGGGNGNQDAIAVINFAGETLDMTTFIEGTNISNGDTFTDITGKSLLPRTVVNGFQMRVVVPPRSFALYVKQPSECAHTNKVYVDQNATGRANGLSWSDAVTHLPSAIALADACASVDTILIAEGTYSTHFDAGSHNGLEIGDGMYIAGGFPSGGSSWANRDIATYETTISGSHSEAYHVITRASGSITSTIDGIFVTYGSANGSTAADQVAGGLVNHGVLSLIDVWFAQHSAAQAPEILLNYGQLECTRIYTMPTDGNKASVLNGSAGMLKFVDEAMIK